MEQRKVCIDCKKPLAAFKGQWLHPDAPCSGIGDYIRIEATIEDEMLHEKFLKLYGTPEIDDTERITVLEADIVALSNQIKFYEGFWVIQFANWLRKFFRRD